MPNYWRAFFEKQLVIAEPDMYQYHCYVMKKNRWGKVQPRFFAISMVWMYNTKCKFNADGDIEFNELKWIAPIEAITKIEVIEQLKANTIEMKLHINSKC